MGAVRKLVTLDSLAVYFNTDSQSITESPRLLKAFRDSVRPRAERSLRHRHLHSSDIPRRERIAGSPVHIEASHE
jgi:hypothetical protein